MNYTARGFASSILLVEDDAADALLIKEALMHTDSTRSVTQVGDGVEALAYLRNPDRARPDLIVLDLNMPRMGGQELLAILKADKDLQVVPAVILSTSKAPEDVAGAYAGHANAYVTKPVDLDAFNTAVRNIEAFFLDTACTPPNGDQQN
jgi:CheY-like chemotaxis protein